MDTTFTQPTTTPRRQLALPRWGNRLLRLLRLALNGLLTFAVLAPIGILLTEIVTPDLELWRRIWGTFLPAALENTLRLAVGTGIGTLLIGTFFAWLITAYEFPGRRWFDRLLLLPLAIPGFIMGFVYVTIFEFAGPVQTALRDQFGWERGDYWFPDIASPAGLILVLTLVLYPYVYLLARAAFQEQSASTLEAAQVLGLGRWRAFWRVTLPLARPHIAAGVLLVIMESMTDYGTVSYFGYPTLSERVIVLWNTSYDIRTATELATLLVFISLILLLAERTMRGQARFYQQGGYGSRVRRTKLRGLSRWSATGACMTLLGVAFVLPVSQLVMWAESEISEPTIYLRRDALIEYTQNSLELASLAALFVMLVALLISYGSRVRVAARGPRFAWLTRLVTMGYAMPGAVIAAGVLTIVNPIDSEVTLFAEENLGWNNPAFLLTGTIAALVYAYVVRFMAVGFNSVDASLEKIKPNMEGAARTLGAGEGRILWRIHLPMVRIGLLTGATLVFVDVMKELPATILLRPFGMDTLALRAHFLSVEGWHRSAAIPSLMILLVGLIPVLILMGLRSRQEKIHGSH